MTTEQQLELVISRLAEGFELLEALEERTREEALDGQERELNLTSLHRGLALLTRTAGAVMALANGVALNVQLGLAYGAITAAQESLTDKPTKG